MIDRKFIFNAINPCNDKEYTQENALILCAKDRAVVPALKAYLVECDRLGCDENHIQSINLLIDRVIDFQANIESRIPDTVGDCEIDRCVGGDV